MQQLKFLFTKIKFCRKINIVEKSRGEDIFCMLPETAVGEEIQNIFFRRRRKQEDIFCILLGTRVGGDI